MQTKDKALEEQRGELQKEKVGMAGKLEELKQKYDQTLDELTQNKINFERDKALKE